MTAVSQFSVTSRWKREKGLGSFARVGLCVCVRASPSARVRGRVLVLLAQPAAVVETGSDTAVPWFLRPRSVVGGFRVSCEAYCPGALRR